MSACIFRDEISHEAVGRLLQLVRAPRYQRRVLINSTGGDPDAIIEQVESIQASRLTTISDHTASAAIYLFALGEQRIAHPNSTFFFHQMTMYTGENDERLTLGELRRREWMASQLNSPMESVYRQDVDYFYMARVATLDLLVAITGSERSTFINLMEGEVMLSAGEALNLNLVHQILPEAQVLEMLRQV